MKVYTESISIPWSPDVADVKRIVDDHIDEYESEYDEYLDEIERKVSLTKRDLSDLEAELEDTLVFEGDSVIKRLTDKERRFVKSLGYNLKWVRKGYFEISI